MDPVQVKESSYNVSTEGPREHPASITTAQDDDDRRSENLRSMVSGSRDDDDGDEIPISSMPIHEDRSGNGVSIKQIPQTQVMERPGYVDSNAPCRIPSSVFARTKSNTPMEWSVASNESLFSIHPGNMSFTRDQFSWLGKSGELGLMGDYYTMSGPLSRAEPVCSAPLVDFDQPPNNNQVQGNKPSEKERKTNASFGEDFKVPESRAAETMRQVIKEEEEKSTPQKTVSKGYVRSSSLARSDASGGSVKSFAFPILTNTTSGSLSHHRHPSSRPPSTPHTPKSAPSQPHSPQFPFPPQSSDVAVDPIQTVTPLNNTRKNCFSCFPRCSFCS